MSPQECKRKHTSREFLDWCAFLEWEVNSFHREDHYLAQIASEIRRGWVEPKKRKNVKDEQFLITFRQKGNRQLTDDEKKQKLLQSKSFWLAQAQVKRKPPDARQRT